MSWDISVQDVPSEAKTIEDIPDDFRPKSIGSRAELIQLILEVVPETDFSDPSWGIYDGRGFSIEFNMGSEQESMGFMMHVRGGGDAPWLIDRLLRHLNLRAFDCSEGAFFKLDRALGSFGAWQEFRDEVIGDEKREEKSG